MIQAGVREKEMKRMQEEGCTCAWYRGLHWERDFDPNSERCPVDHNRVVDGGMFWAKMWRMLVNLLLIAAPLVVIIVALRFAVSDDIKCGNSQDTTEWTTVE